MDFVSCFLPSRPHCTPKLQTHFRGHSREALHWANQPVCNKLWPQKPQKNDTICCTIGMISEKVKHKQLLQMMG